MTPTRICAILASTLLAAACGQAPAGDKGTAANRTEAAPPATDGHGNAAANAVTPSNGASATPGAGPLTAYLGKLTSDRIGGTTFLDRSEVRTAVQTLVPDAGVRRWLLDPDTTQAPIALRGGRVHSGACEPHNCGPHQWSIELGADGSAPEICYHDDRQDESHSRWFAAGQPPQTRPGRCEGD